MTKDLALLISRDAPWLTTDEFMNALDENLAKSPAPDARTGSWTDSGRSHIATIRP